ncbi:MAG: sugar isomerase [Planctomycetota bacterium]|jgi:L-fucose isomerase-like protein
MTLTDTAAKEHAQATRVGFMAIGRKRPGFDADWGRRIADAAWDAVTAVEFEADRPDQPVIDDASARAAVEAFAQRRCDTLIVLQPTMGDGRLAPILAQLWGKPLVLWATPERPDSDKVSSCSLVGAHVFGSMLRQLRRPFELVYGDPDDASVRQALRDAVQLTIASSRLGRSTIGLVGTHAPGFVNMHVDPFQHNNDLGSQLRHSGIEELAAMIENIEGDRVNADVAEVKALGLSFGEGLGEADLHINSRYYLAMSDLIEELRLDALAVRCWPELPNRFGHWPYLAMSRLADRGEVVALEGDADGAVTGLIGQLLGLGVGYISDWLEHDRDSITLWHPGHAPGAMIKPGSARLGRHFNDGRPLVVDAQLITDQPITLCRLWRCDNAYRMTAFEAMAAPPRRPIRGATGLALLEGLDACKLFDHLVHEGMPHHVTVFPGRRVELLRRFARLHGVRWVESI